MNVYTLISSACLIVASVLNIICSLRNRRRALELAQREDILREGAELYIQQVDALCEHTRNQQTTLDMFITADSDDDADEDEVIDIYDEDDEDDEPEVVTLKVRFDEIDIDKVRDYDTRCFLRKRQLLNSFNPN